MKSILAKRLRACRREKGFTQNQVAIYCDITEKTYQNYELMAREPKLEILIKIADLFDEMCIRDRLLILPYSASAFRAGRCF